MKAEHRENLQVNLTDVEAVLMDTPHGFVVGYNGQISVDNASRLIGAWELSQEGAKPDLAEPTLYTR